MSDEGFAPLEGIKVIELGDGLAGSICGRMLADLGADVIKVERPPHGDGARAATELDRNKRGIAVDLTRPEGLTLARRLLRAADVAIDGWPPGTLEGFGLGYEGVRPHNPGLVWCEPSPRRIDDSPATGDQDGSAAAETSAADTTAGILAATGTLAAILHRLLTGDGQRVEIETSAALLAPASASPLKLSGSPTATGRAAPALGEHTREVLLENGYTDDGVAELRNAGVVHCSG
ncbi:MAG: CoA transferase [Acidobacteriota bacterium]|jgi:crotonobetainyl-CoA:carnitine CoA-transferase CaiB-like acyl-CoA transferase